jgi:hypothetical protein
MTTVKLGCQKCKRRILTFGFDCKCGILFCIKCRMPEVHGCKFDYKEEAAKILEKQNPKISGEKLDKI